MSDPVNIPSTIKDSPLSFYDPGSFEFTPPGDEFNTFEGYDPSNAIIQGVNNEIINSRRCTIINGAYNKIVGNYNTHIIGNGFRTNDPSQPLLSDAIYLGCNNGLHVYGPIEARMGLDLYGDLTLNGRIQTSNGMSIVGDIFVDGKIEATDDVIAFASSDERLKDNITYLSGSLNKIQSLNPIEFDWSDNQSRYYGHDIGLIAQEVSGIAPEIVSERPDGYLAMKYEKVIPLLVGAIQDQQKIIEEMRAEIKDLKER
jgi:hypothetical protein